MLDDSSHTYHEVAPAFAGELKGVADEVIASFQVNLHTTEIRYARKKLVPSCHGKGLIDCVLQCPGAIILTCGIGIVIRHIKYSGVSSIPLHEQSLTLVIKTLGPSNSRAVASGSNAPSHVRNADSSLIYKVHRFVQI